MKATYPKAKFLFPAGKAVFSSYAVSNDKHIKARSLYNDVKALDGNVWLHLFREKKGASIARAMGRSLDSVYTVKDTLDLAREETAYRYIRRYAIQEVKASPT